MMACLHQRQALFTDCCAIAWRTPAQKFNYVPFCGRMHQSIWIGCYVFATCQQIYFLEVCIYEHLYNSSLRHYLCHVTGNVSPVERIWFSKVPSFNSSEAVLLSSSFTRINKNHRLCINLYVHLYMNLYTQSVITTRTNRRRCSPLQTPICQLVC